MRMNCKAVLLGADEKTSAKGNKYISVLFQSGTETITTMYTGSDDISQLKKYEDYNFVLDYNPRWKSFNIISISK